ncbi:hypothetical protein ACS0TY_017597 [Phlomoides rotata]
MYNSLEDLAILSSCGVKGRPPRAPTIKFIRWQAPPFQVMMINVDGGASGSPGHLTGEGVFRDNFGVFRCCFAVSHGRGLPSRLSSLLLFTLSNLPMIEAGPTSSWKVTLLMRQETKEPPPTSKHRRPRWHLWSTSRKTKNPQNVHREFRSVSRRWTKSSIH